MSTHCSTDNCSHGAKVVCFVCGIGICSRCLEGSEDWIECASIECGQACCSTSCAEHVLEPAWYCDNSQTFDCGDRGNDHESLYEHQQDCDCGTVDDSAPSASESED